MVYDGQVMSDEHIGQTHLILKFLQQVQDLSLNGYIQSGYRFVTDNELGIHSQCTGNSDTLTASAIQLMRIGVDQTVSQTYNLHQLPNTIHLIILIRYNLIDF